MMICFQRMSQLLKCEHVIANAFRAEFSSSRSGVFSQDSQPTTTPIRGRAANSWKRWFLVGCCGTVALAGGVLLQKYWVQIAYADMTNLGGGTYIVKIEKQDDLPTFRMDEVKKHGRNAERIWVTCQGGVYDVTDFVESHPGGDKILLAAGSSIDPYWNIYQQHNTPETVELLEEMRIGNLDERDIVVEELRDEDDPYRNDPKRHPALLVNSQKPFNAETPTELILDNFFTPNDLFFVRSHMPVPDVDAEKHKLTIDGLTIRRPLVLSVRDLKRQFARVSVNATLQCAGNRRVEMSQMKKVQGLNWKGTAISNAKWTGARLRDVLLKAGIDPKDKRIKHVILRGCDMDAEGNVYEASITFEKAMHDEVIIAYEMNDQELSRDHGYPLRLIAPGIVGARQVKYLTSIRLSEEESTSHWQKKDYRALPPFIGLSDNQDFELAPSIQEYPVQSAFCRPAGSMKVSRSDGEFEVMGYAWSGGGRGIIRVDISTDGGETWHPTELTQDPDQDLEHMWSWTFFKASVQIPEGVSKMDLVCKATDRSYNTQPDTARGIWNVRGLINNCWHHVSVEIVDD